MAGTKTTPEENAFPREREIEISKSYGGEKRKIKDFFCARAARKGKTERERGPIAQTPNTCTASISLSTNFSVYSINKSGPATLVVIERRRKTFFHEEWTMVRTYVRTTLLCMCIVESSTSVQLLVIRTQIFVLGSRRHSVVGNCTFKTAPFPCSHGPICIRKERVTTYALHASSTATITIGKHISDCVILSLCVCKQSPPSFLPSLPCFPKAYNHAIFFTREGTRIREEEEVSAKIDRHNKTGRRRKRGEWSRRPNKSG